MFNQEEVKELNGNYLRGINKIYQEIEFLKRDIIRSFKNIPKHKEVKPSLFGSVKSEDITEEMIEESKQSLFRSPEGLI